MDGGGGLDMVDAEEEQGTGGEALIFKIPWVFLSIYHVHTSIAIHTPP